MFFFLSFLKLLEINLLLNKIELNLFKLDSQIFPVSNVLWAIHVRVKVSMTSQEKKKTPDLTKLLLTVFLPGLSFHTESMCTYCHHLECLWWSLHQGIPSHRKEEKNRATFISVLGNYSLSPRLSPTPLPSLPLPPIKKILSYPLPVWEHNGR